MRKESIYKVISVLILILPLFAFAQAEAAQAAKSAAEGIARILGWVAIGIGAVVFALGVYKIAVSGGDPRGLSEGTHSIVWGIVGIALGIALINLNTILAYFGVTW